MFPDIQFASLVPFQQAIDQARVCIVEYLGSTFLEAICANVPSVVFHSSNLYNVREEAKPFINKLIEVGIMYYDPVEAAKHVGKVYDDISSWWDSDDVQEARNSFVDRFAKTHQNWTHMWHNALTQELKN
jgi:putative transferase (TIGR04331 family)